MCSSEKKQKQPPCLISSLPEEILVDIVARVPRFYYPTLSHVSRRFRCLVSCPDVFARRSLLGMSEECLYVAISKDQTSDIHWFTLCRLPGGNRLIHIPSLPPMPLHGSYVPFGSNIFVMGGFHNWNITATVSLIDCRTHTSLPLPDMPKAVTASVSQVVDANIYVIGGSDTTFSPMKSPSRTMMVFDTQTHTWLLRMRPDWEQRKTWFSSVHIGGKIYMRTCYNSFVYDPKDDNCEKDDVLHSKEWTNPCVVEDVLYYYDVVAKCLRAYDPKQRSWRLVKGLEGLLPECCSWSKTASYKHGKLTLFLQRQQDIWCAEIAVERRQLGQGEKEEIWGKVDWCDVVLCGDFHIMDCVAVTVRF